MRTYQILKALAQSDAYMPLNYFVDDLKVSKRTVQSEMAFIKQSGRAHGYQLRNAYGKGYALEVTDKRLFDAFLKTFDKDEAVFNEEQLVIDILDILLTADHEYTTVAELAKAVGYSSALLYNKMQTVENFVGSYGVKLERRSHYGVRLVGSGRAIRKLMLEIYLKGSSQFKKLTDDRVGSFDEYDRIAEDCIREEHLRIGYYEFQVLMAWLRVLVIYAKVFTTRTNGPENILTIREHSVGLKKVLEAVARNFQIELTTDVATEFDELVKQSIQSEKAAHSVVDKEQLKAKLITFFDAADVKNHTNYGQDEKFINALTVHLAFLLERIDKKITYKNPLLLELCVRYPMVFDLVLKFSKFLENEFGVQVSNDELGFIAVHFLNHVTSVENDQVRRYERIAVICTTGGGVSNLIRTQILGIFPQSIVQAFSFWEENDIADFDPDLIFSVVPLKQEPKVPTLYVKELLTNRDIENIKQVLFTDGLDNEEPAKIDVTAHDIASDYLNLIKPGLFQVVRVGDYQQLITDMAQDMVDQGYGDTEFVQNVQKREEFMSTIYNNGIAMPHPIEMKGRSSAIAVSILKPQLQVGEKVVRLVFMVCLAKRDFQYYSSISNSIFQLMQSETKVSQVYNDPSLTSLVSTLKEIGD
ncbi:BglG family transcription antiterminator [Lacticaseibacillus zhaodongensis]|uniref:BglG family transcription antiterminator n=1 Tax=Lacticaseibacillus zhaodongensis TaxID=2668065 RepID=UPI0012D2EFA3|nr:PRD domain-containing protein [Lacticaseibacillus zhaodongensis]